MAYRNGPKIVTDGLVLCLDAAIGKSYPGSGNTWYDLSGNGNNGTFGASTAAPTFSAANGGSIVFDGVDDYVSLQYDSSLSFGSSNWTIESWIYPSSFDDYGMIWDHGYGSPNTLRSIVVYIDRTTGLLRIAQSPNGSTNYDVSLGISVMLNGWNHIAVTKSGSSIIPYLNTISSNSITAYDLYDSTTRSHYIGIQGDFQSVTDYEGNISNFRIYKGNALSANEVQQNYKATKGRFGL